MKVMPGYKQTEVGVIPDEWEPKVLMSVVSIANGQVDPRKEPFRSMILVAPDHIESSTGKLLAKRTAEEQRAISGKYQFSAGDIVYSKIRPYLKKAILADFAGLCSADMYPLRPVEGVDGGYILPVLLAHRFSKYAESVSVRSGMPKINRAELAGFSVAVPPPSEQRAIAGALSDVDALLGRLDRLIAKKRDLKQAAMQQLLTGQTRLPGFSGEWEVKSLGELSEIVMGQSPSSANYNSQGFGLPLIQGNADILDRKTIRRFFTTQITKRGLAGDTLMSVRAPVGEISRATFDVCLGRGVCAIRFPNEWLYHFLIFIEPTWAKHSKGSTFESVNSTDVRSVEVRLPVDPKEQTAIAEVLNQMDGELVALQQRKKKTATLKQGMMQELLTGRTRLV